MAAMSRGWDLLLKTLHLSTGVLLAFMPQLALGKTGPGNTQTLKGSEGLRTGAVTREQVPWTPRLEDLNLPQEFLSMVQNRQRMDQFQQANYQVEPGGRPQPKTSFRAKSKSEAGFKIFRAPLPLQHSASGQSLPLQIRPLRSFIAPVLGQSAWVDSRSGDAGAYSSAEVQAARLIQNQLCRDGLMATTLECLRILIREQPERTPSGLVKTLREIGLPVDWLRFFRSAEAGGAASDGGEGTEAVVAHLLTSLREKASAKPAPHLEFRYFRSGDAFQIGTEGGEEAIGLMRFQIEGGWDGGMIPGSAIDVVGQLMESFRESDYVISASQEMEPLITRLARGVWRWRRADQLKICLEQVRVGSWPQDNAKGGVVVRAADGATQWGTLIPRYASIHEGVSVFRPGDSFLMDGLAAAGMRVLQSPLLFQGGNLIATVDPSDGKRVLWLGEGEVHRNRAMGLSESEVLETFRVEFGVDRVQVLPAVSYHLDFDVSFRVRGGRIVALVNDASAAARLIIIQGLQALEQRGMLDATTAGKAREQLQRGGLAQTVKLIRYALPYEGTERQRLPTRMAEAFVSGPSDDAARNLQIFMLGLDYMESLDRSGQTTGVMGERAVYLGALNEMKRASDRLSQSLRELGCKVVEVPSMPDMHRSLNYLNGLQTREAMVVPVHGGFYSALDRAALEVVQMALGAETRLIPVPCAELQSLHGGVHCAVSVYPLLNNALPQQNQAQ